MDMGATGNVLTILFADICESTALYERVGNEQASRMTLETLQRLQYCAADEGGTVVKSLGDGILVTFPSADSAFLAATTMLKIQGREPLAVSIGFHQGDVVTESGDVFGDAVNYAARLASMAKTNEILITEETLLALEPFHQSQASFFDYLAVKGRSEPSRIYSIRNQEETEATSIVGPAAANAAPPTILALNYQGREIRIDQSTREFVMGREVACNLVVAGQFVSRRHARIDCRRGTFMITDLSTNGTYLRLDQPEVVVLKRDGLRLSGSGVFSLGSHPDDNEENLITFQRIAD